MSDDFLYDVAISLLERDLDLAEQLRGLFENRIRIFLYSERQKELASRDGMDQFTAAFRRDSRTVLVLARKDWGSTKWTRVEETAIKNRGFDEGWNFLTLAPLDGRDSVPDWVPLTYVWADLDRLGTQGLAAVIEQKLKDVGGQVRKESAEDLHRRIEEQQQREAERRTFLGSPRGVQAADGAFDELCLDLENRAPALEVSARRDSLRGIAITKDGVSLSLSWHRTYSNTLNDSQLWVKLWDGILSNHVSGEFRAKATVSELAMTFDVRAETHGWREEGGSHRFLPPTELAEHCLKALLRAANGELVEL